MPKYKTIRIKKRGGGTRPQRVQVLASGKYKFVKNIGSKKRRGSRPAPRRKRRKMAKKKKSYSRARGLIGKYGAIGIAEDLGWGLIGTNMVMGAGYPLEMAMPIARIIQGIQGKALKRRGAGRLEHGILDLIDVYLIKNGVRLPNIISLSAFK